MKPRDPKARSLEALQAAMDRHEGERARSVARGPEPWPGDLYVLSETADLPIEWLVVERAASGRCRVVAADTHPALGNADVPVPAESEGGPLSVRCAVSLEVGVEILRRGERTGTVDPEILDPVRRRLEELTAGSLDAAPDPELEDWHAEVLAPARAAFLKAGMSGMETPGLPRRWRLRTTGVAALFLLIALAGVSALAWRFHQGELQARREVERLLHERREPAGVPPGVPPVPPRPLINLAYANFYPGTTRGTLREIEVPRQATHLFLLFYVGDQDGCASYELDIARRVTPAASFTVTGLLPLPGREVSVAVPRAQLPDGSYQLRLYGLCGQERRALGDYGARLKEGGR